ncbi:tripartite motif-containing protein 16-like protein [Electrophorus electricus]|uniref:tripartite motif-containing protein 16-like protein n=1 Tax=Electrophorus electricus TaxID=8005 RepID=UPI0015D05C77|nr:tripartite motif-containing protein 16-like protein [Electrophorus electricus]
MAEASISVDQDQFSCPICLDLLKDPVTINCGHSFCMVCINDYWDQDDQRGIYSCPQCRETFSPRPVLHRNNMLAEVVEKLKKTELHPASPAHCYARPGDLECDFCTGRKRKASESCLVCQTSFCETHRKSHYEVPALKKHKLIKASTRLQEMICSQHDKVIEIYCRTDQSCICYLCTMDEHKGHDTVSAAAGRTEKQNSAKEVQSKSQWRIQEKEKKVQELKQAVNTLKRSAQAALEDSESIFTELIHSIKEMLSELTEMIRAKEKTELSRAEGLQEKLEQEIADLKRRDTELEQLSHTENDTHFLQSFQSVCNSSGTVDPLGIYFIINKQLSFDGIKQILSNLKEQLEEICMEEFNKVHPQVAVGEIILLSEPKSREDFLQYFCQITLDPNTANDYLCLSEKARMVTNLMRAEPQPDHPERFTHWRQVLCKERVCGRCYWEVDWTSKGYWLTISVSYIGIDRKGRGIECGFGCNDQSWSLVCFPILSFWHDNFKTEIQDQPSSRIGVYVDHSAGTLSFYSVSDTMTLLHRVHTTFTQPLYAGFGLTWGTVKLCDLK